VSTDNPNTNGDGNKSLSADQILTLFKFYQDKGWAVKLQALTCITWFTPAIFALLAFSANEYFGEGLPTTLAAVAAATALLLTVFLWRLIGTGLSHANSDYRQAEAVLSLDVSRRLLPPELVTIMRGHPHPDDRSQLEHVGPQFLKTLTFAGRLLILSALWALFLAAMTLLPLLG
jgi:hypothetical protein